MARRAGRAGLTPLLWPVERELLGVALAWVLPCVVLVPLALTVVDARERWRLAEVAGFGFAIPLIAYRSARRELLARAEPRPVGIGERCPDPASRAFRRELHRSALFLGVGLVALTTDWLPLNGVMVPGLTAGVSLGAAVSAWLFARDGRRHGRELLVENGHLGPLRGRKKRRVVLRQTESGDRA